MSYRRNLVVFLAHGLRSDATGDTMAWPFVAPQMEALCKRGLRRAAVSASSADQGGMISLFTGLHARQHGHLEPTSPGLTCEGWPALLTDAGYHAVGVGCVRMVEPWLSKAVIVDDVTSMEDRGCSYLESLQAKGLAAAVLQQRRQRARGGLFEPDRLMIEPKDDIDGYIAARAVEQLAHMPDDRPWVLLVVFSGPGNDLPAPTLYDHLIEPGELESGFTPADFTELDDLAELDFPRVLLQRLEPRHVGRIRSDYLGRVSLIDHGVGQVLAAVAQRADRERTWTLVSSDRGQLLGERGLVGHRSFLDGAVHVPVIVAPPPPSPQRQRDAEMVSTVDVAATIADLAGCDLPRCSVGRSLLNLFRKQPLGSPLAGAGLCEFGNRLMLVTDRYKVIFDTHTHHAIGLYDLVNDEDEKTNLVNDSVGRNVLDSLRWRLGDALMPLRALPR